jgi:hypothetical protein
LLPVKYALTLAPARSAKKAGDALKETSGRGISFGEETITETTLLDLLQAVPTLRAKAFSKRQESQIGADWDFWVEGRYQWFAFTVQAKRAKRSSGRVVSYDIGYISGKSQGNPGTRQIDILETSSRKKRLPAIYALYNEPDLADADYVRPSCKQAYHRAQKALVCCRCGWREASGRQTRPSHCRSPSPGLSQPLGLAWQPVLPQLSAARQRRGLVCPHRILPLELAHRRKTLP